MTNKPWSRWSQWVWGLSDWRALLFKKIENLKNRLWKIFECQFWRTLFLQKKKPTHFHESKSKTKELTGIFPRRDRPSRWLKIETLSQGVIGHESKEDKLHCWLLTLNWDSSYSTVTEMTFRNLNPHITSDSIMNNCGIWKNHLLIFLCIFIDFTTLDIIIPCSLSNKHI